MKRKEQNRRFSALLETIILTSVIKITVRDKFLSVCTTSHSGSRCSVFFTFTAMRNHSGEALDLSEMKI
jgi:hypothetical protein